MAISIGHTVFTIIVNFCKPVMIKITKTVVEVDNIQFYNEVKRVCEEINRFDRRRIGCKFPVFKRELGLKLTQLQFFKVCEECGIEVKRDIVFLDQFKSI